MAYIGNQPIIGNWRKLDDISGSFNGSTTSFTTAVEGDNVTAATANQLFISLGGVIQEPGVDFTVTTNSIIFTTAPASGLSFFGIYAGDSLNLAGPSDGTVDTASLVNGAVTSDKIAAGTYVSTWAVGTGASAAANTDLDVAGTYAGNVVSVAALDIDCSTGNYFTKSISTSSTFTFSNVPASRAYSFTLEVNCTGGGTAITWPAAVKWPADTAPTLTDGKTHLFLFVTDNGGTTFRGASLVDYTT